ncbi:MAG: hypothetical protein SOX72_07555, partial [Oscillospiraceae bacterium]|nr:hypothetical protein [Oscillospiraceae bacterium]
SSASFFIFSRVSSKMASLSFQKLPGPHPFFSFGSFYRRTTAPLQLSCIITKVWTKYQPFPQSAPKKARNSFLAVSGCRA